MSDEEFKQLIDECRLEYQGDLDYCNRRNIKKEWNTFEEWLVARLEAERMRYSDPGLGSRYSE